MNFDLFWSGQFHLAKETRNVITLITWNNCIEIRVETLSIISKQVKTLKLDDFTIFRMFDNSTVTGEVTLTHFDNFSFEKYTCDFFENDMIKWGASRVPDGRHLYTTLYRNRMKSSSRRRALFCKYISARGWDRIPLKVLELMSTFFYRYVVEYECESCLLVDISSPKSYT